MVRPDHTFLAETTNWISFLDHVYVLEKEVGRDLGVEISIYWGYRVKQSKFKLATLLEKEKFDLRIGTS